MQIPKQGLYHPISPLAPYFIHSRLSTPAPPLPAQKLCKYLISEETFFAFLQLELDRMISFRINIFKERFSLETSFHVTWAADPLRRSPVARGPPFRAGIPGIAILRKMDPFFESDPIRNQRESRNSISVQTCKMFVGHNKHRRCYVH